MKITVATTIALMFLLSAGVANAAEEQNAWYLSQGDQYLVRESIHGQLHALMSISKSNKPHIYILMSDSDCEDDSGDIENHAPLYVNGVLTRYLQYCSGVERYFLPATETGRKYLINEFKRKNFVTITTVDGSFKMVFSAQGFTAVYNKVVLRNSGI